MSPKKTTSKSGSTSKKAAKQPRKRAGASFTADEREAMKERAREVKAETRRGKGASADGERDVLDKIADMPGADRTMATRLHAIIREHAPDLEPRTWYGMPAYARDGKVICFFQSAQKFKSRYATLGFSDQAKLDDGAMWPTSYALKQLTAREEAAIVKLVKQAVG